ncbi:MAG: hypothetical protein A4E62_02241 [Syntrophorhabdus sp. PtaU1.Bin002]|nr:MAG: hypothetical protein A4E62_02241 [Syntrophorhabdus sp. PtaU1.Bin002]
MAAYLPLILSKTKELIIIPNVIVLFIFAGSQHQTNSAGRKLEEFPPDTRYNHQTVIRPIEGDNLPILAVIKQYAKRTTSGNNELIQFFMGVATPIFTSGDIIKIINPLYVKRNMRLAFNNGDITRPVMYLT